MSLNKDKFYKNEFAVFEMLLFLFLIIIIICYVLVAKRLNWTLGPMIIIMDFGFLPRTGNRYAIE